MLVTDAERRTDREGAAADADIDDKSTGHFVTADLRSDATATPAMRFIPSAYSLGVER